MYAVIGLVFPFRDKPSSNEFPALTNTAQFSLVHEDLHNHSFSQLVIQLKDTHKDIKHCNK
jgi:hypothetical protein